MIVIITMAKYISEIIIKKALLIYSVYALLYRLIVSFPSLKKSIKNEG